MSRFVQSLTSLSAVLLILVASIIVTIVGFPKEISNGGVSSYQCLAIIDASQVENKAGDTIYKGLPDSHDFSKHKDFFAIYVHRYCSGKKDGDRYKTDFCSRIGSELFDQYRVWKAWGVDLVRRDLPTPPDSRKDQAVEPSRELHLEAIKTFPKVIFIWFTITMVTLISTLLISCIGVCTYWGKIVASIICVFSTVSSLVTAGLCQYLFPTLVSQTKNYRIPNTNSVLESQLGVSALAGLWVVAALSLISSFLLAFTIHSDRKRRRSNKEEKGPEKYTGISRFGDAPGIIRRATGKLMGSYGISRYDDTSYETLRVRGRSKSREPPRSRDPSAERAAPPVLEKSESHERDEKASARYEPYRPHEIPS